MKEGPDRSSILPDALAVHRLGGILCILDLDQDHMMFRFSAEATSRVIDQLLLLTLYSSTPLFGMDGDGIMPYDYGRGVHATRVRFAPFGLKGILRRTTGIITSAFAWPVKY